MEYGSIGWAVSHLRKGWKLRRGVWPEGVFIAYLPEGAVQVPGKLLEDKAGAGARIRELLMLRDTAGHFVPFTASQNDLFGTDWMLIDAPQPGHTKMSEPVEPSGTPA